MVVYGEEPVSPYTAKVCSNIDHWQSYQLAWNAQVLIHFAEEHDQHNFWKNLSVPCNFFHRNIWAHHSECCNFSWRSNECIHDLQTVTIKLMKTLPSFLHAADWWWQGELSWFFGHHWMLVESTLHIILFPQTGGQDMVNICWTDSDFCGNCRACNTMHMFEDRFHYQLPMLGLHWEGYHLSLPGHS
jgi:hypothetical protein